MRRRRALLTVAALLIVANGVYFLVFRSKEPEGVMASWIVYMPELEASQRANPANFLDTSEIRDPRYPILYLSEDGIAFPLFAKVASDCGVLGYAIQSYLQGDGSTQPVQMPDRFFVSDLNGRQETCVRERLPAGYRLARLAKPVRPTRVGWAETDLQLASTESN